MPLGSNSRTSPQHIALHNSNTLIYAVGDVHGCSDLYDRLETEIRADAHNRAPNRPILVVLLGDFIDRGPDSAGMVERLLEDMSAQSGTAPLKRISLLGNHERMFQKFLDAPSTNAAWLNYGGVETLASYGLYPSETGQFEMSDRRFAQAVYSVIPDSHRKYLNKLPTSLRVPGYLLCHAALDPTRPLRDQDEEPMLWGKPEALDNASPDSPLLTEMADLGLQLVHGHVPQLEPQQTGSRINLDTGAYTTGNLSAACLGPGELVAFLQVCRS